MLQFLIAIFFVLVCLLYINRKIGVLTTKVPEEIDDDFIELPDEKGYWDETNEAIIKLKKEIDITGIRKEDIEKISELKREISNGFKQWENVVQVINQMITQKTKLMSQGSFFPKDFALDINKLKMEKENARENQLNNPLKSPEQIKLFINDQQEKINNYIEIKTKVEDMLEKLEIYEKSLKTKQKSIEYFKKKQELFIYIQNGDFKGARKILKDMKSKIKNSV
ncbi:hypothetical protein AAGG74_18825 [Bacillus mexicanus]|uniref:hypothetical protein n=1 Tax=Bacillus mexicanus TaxID=2834415 RepID=UPI003D19595A